MYVGSCIYLNEQQKVFWTHLWIPAELEEGNNNKFKQQEMCVIDFIILKEDDLKESAQK